jgi:hypothetical protein
MKNLILNHPEKIEKVMSKKADSGLNSTNCYLLLFVLSFYFK